MKWCKKLLLTQGKYLSEDDYIFLSYQTGKPISDGVLLYSLRRVIKITGLEKQVSPHGLRHTHATVLIKQRIPVKTIADRLGNTPTIMMEIYGHSFEELEK